MSIAFKCDRCGTFEQAAINNISLQCHVVTNVEDDDATSYSYEVDFCAKCSAEFLNFTKIRLPI